MATYIYSVINDTLNGVVYLPGLVDEILDAGGTSFAVDFSHINIIDDVLEIIFDVNLSPSDESELNTIVNNHDGVDQNSDSSISEFMKADSIGFKSLIYIGDLLTSIELFLDAGMTTRIYTKDFNYTGDLLTSVVLTRESDSSIFTKTITYSGDVVTDVVYS